MIKQTTQIILLSLLATACNANPELTQPPTPQPSASSAVSSPEPGPSAMPSLSPTASPSSAPSASPSSLPSTEPSAENAPPSFRFSLGEDFELQANESIKLLMYKHNQLVGEQSWSSDLIGQELDYQPGNIEVGAHYFFQILRQNGNGTCQAQLGRAELAAQHGLNSLNQARVELNNPAYLSGQFISDQGRPLADAQVTIQSKGFPFNTQLKTDAQGHFFVSELPAAETLIILEKEGYPRQEIRQNLLAGNSCQFEQNHLRIEAPVLPLAENEFQFYFDTRSLTLNPQDNVMVKMYVDNSLVDEALYLGSEVQAALILNTDKIKKGDAAHFEVYVPEKAESCEQRLFSRQIESFTGQKQTVILTPLEVNVLEPFVTLSGRVLDERGLPLPDAEVKIASKSTKAPYAAQALVGARGEFLFENVPSGVEVTLRVKKEGYSKGDEEHIPRSSRSCQLSDNFHELVMNKNN